MVSMGTPLVDCTFIKFLMGSLQWAVDAGLGTDFTFPVDPLAACIVAAFPQSLLGPRECGSVVTWERVLQALRKAQWQGYGPRSRRISVSYCLRELLFCHSLREVAYFFRFER